MGMFSISRAISLEVAHCLCLASRSTKLMTIRQSRPIAKRATRQDDAGDRMERLPFLSSCSSEAKVSFG